MEILVALNLGQFVGAGRNVAVVQDRKCRNTVFMPVKEVSVLIVHQLFAYKRSMLNAISQL